MLIITEIEILGFVLLRFSSEEYDIVEYRKRTDIFD